MLTLLPLSQLLPTSAMLRCRSFMCFCVAIVCFRLASTSLSALFTYRKMLGDQKLGRRSSLIWQKSDGYSESGERNQVSYDNRTTTRQRREQTPSGNPSSVAVRHAAQIILRYVYRNHKWVMLRHDMKVVADIALSWPEYRLADFHTLDLDVTESKVHLLWWHCAVVASNLKHWCRPLSRTKQAVFHIIFAARCTAISTAYTVTWINSGEANDGTLEQICCSYDF